MNSAEKKFRPRIMLGVAGALGALALSSESAFAQGHAYQEVEICLEDSPMNGTFMHLFLLGHERNRLDRMHTDWDTVVASIESQCTQEDFNAARRMFTNMHNEEEKAHLLATLESLHPRGANE